MYNNKGDLKMSKKNYTMYLDKEIIEKVQKEAEKNDRTISWTINDLIKKGFKNN